MIIYDPTSLSLVSSSAYRYHHASRPEDLQYLGEPISITTDQSESTTTASWPNTIGTSLEMPIWLEPLLHSPAA